MPISQFATRDEAWHHMDRLVEDRWGSDAEALAGLEIREYPCRRLGGRTPGVVIAAKPKGWSGDANNIRCVYFGEAIVPAAAC